MTELAQYQWGEWPDHLLTKKQMDEAGYQTGSKLPAPAGYVRRSKSPGGVMLLYDRNQGVPKRQLSADALDRAKARGEGLRQGYQCVRCGRRLPVYVKGGGNCDRCSDHYEMVDWAAGVLAQEPRPLILDTETSGLEAGYNEIVQLAIIDVSGAVLFDSLISPQHPERLYETGGRGLRAFDIHGIGAERLAGAPAFPQVYLRVREILRRRYVLVYNLNYDMRMLAGDCDRHRLPRLGYRGADCVMLAYAQWYGAWNDYHGDYRWQPLNGGHSALSDCWATLGRLQRMAADGVQVDTREVEENLHD